MKVTQLTVFLENRSGRLAEVADILGQAGINIRGFSTTEAAEYGIVRLIVTDPDRARQLLHDAGFTTHFSEVLCVKVEDVPGGLAEVLDQLAAAGVVHRLPVQHLVLEHLLRRARHRPRRRAARRQGDAAQRRGGAGAVTTRRSR